MSSSALGPFAFPLFFMAVSGCFFFSGSFNPPLLALMRPLIKAADCIIEGEQMRRLIPKDIDA